MSEQRARCLVPRVDRNAGDPKTLPCVIARIGVMWKQKRCQLFTGKKLAEIPTSNNQRGLMIVDRRIAYSKNALEGIARVMAGLTFYCAAHEYWPMWITVGGRFHRSTPDRAQDQDPVYTRHWIRSSVTAGSDPPRGIKYKRGVRFRLMRFESFHGGRTQENINCGDTIS